MLLAACLELPSVDLEGPAVLSSTPAEPRSVEVPVWPVIEIELSEPLDPASVHAGSVALIAWEEAGSCALTPLCEEGSCERGRCMLDPLTKADLADLDRGELEGGIELELELLTGSAGPDTRLRARPRRPLAAHWRHSLILGAALSDRSGASLDESFRRDFVTAAAGSSGPEPTLITPSPAEQAVPTNLAHVELAFSPPLTLSQPQGTILLEDERGEQIVLSNPSACERWPPGTCVRLDPSQSLSPNTRYRPVGGSLHDRLGRAAILPAAERETWFQTGASADLDPPAPDVDVALRGRCLVASIDTTELLHARLIVDDRARERLVAPGEGMIGVAIDEHLPGDPVFWQLELRDRADNQLALDGQLVADASSSPELPAIRITELLANPLGPEPDAEFIEIVALAPTDTAGLMLSDQSFAQLLAAWSDGDEPNGDPLPATTLEPNRPTLLVSNKWTAQLGDDPSPAAGTPMIVLDASLGASGLKNAGEPITLWLASDQGPRLVASYGNWIDTGAKAHGGRSVIGDLDGCDLPDRWRSHPLGTSTPGTIP